MDVYFTLGESHRAKGPSDSAHTADRIPYVRAGEEGCRRSARVDRDEADGLSWTEPRKDELLESAQQWEDKAHRLMLERVGPRPTLTELRVGVGNEQWLAALALLELSPALASDAAQFARQSNGGGRYVDAGTGDPAARVLQPTLQMDWDGWAADVDERGRGWSSTEARLFEIVAALTVADRMVSLVGVFAYLGSWERGVLGVFVRWASGGNNREFPGRLPVEEQS